MKNRLQFYSKKIFANILALLLTIGLTATTLPAQQRSASENREQINEARKEAREATKVLNEMMRKPDNFVPRELLERAQAIAIIPDVVKAAFIIGGRGGDGLVSRRTANGWSVPVFYDMGGASIGAQIGGNKTDYIMLFMNEGALRDLLDEKVEFGGDLSFAAGPIGRTAGVSTNPTLDAGVLTWSRSKGAFVGASIKGAVLTADNDVNNAIYGMSAKDVLANPETVKMAELPNEIRNFTATVARYAGTKTMATNQNNNGATATNVQYASAGYTPNERADRSREFARMRSRERLAREIRNELLTLPYYSVFDWLEFEVDRDGAVTLRGQVTTPPDTKSRAEAYVKDVEGVTRVINNIEVLPLSPNDDRLRQALYREIYSGPLFRYQVGSQQNIHIIVKNGRATLKGIVDSEADKNFAGIRAKTVSGVFEVNNELFVRTDANRAQ